MNKSKNLYKPLIFLVIFFQVLLVYLYKIPNVTPELDSAGFTNASDTLSNGRLSYRAGVDTGVNNSSLVTIDSSGNADNNTNHLFPKDVVCFSGSLLDGCYNNATNTVANIIDSTNFNFSPPLGPVDLSANDYVIASQSAIHTIAFTLTNEVPLDGSIYITVPSIDVTGKTDDSFPDTNVSIATNGFDLGGVGTGNISVASSGCANNWTVASVTAGDASNDHRILINRSTDSCVAGSTITVTIGDGTKKMINPAPITGHTQGSADVYTLNVKTRDGSTNTLDQSNIKVAVIEGVLVSATVQETLSVTIAGVASSTSVCGISTDVTTTATSVPWGTIVNFGAFQEAAQTVTVSTNADAGYVLKVEENDQMGKDGKVCSSPTSDTADATDNCIQDTTCSASVCSESTSQDWTSTSYYGLGYTLANASGTDASFLYNESARAFSAKQFADQEATNTKQTIMSNAGPVASSQIDLCYRLNVSAVQPAGYYFNKVQLTATATF
jgi:hypothetical protein